MNFLNIHYVGSEDMKSNKIYYIKGKSNRIHVPRFLGISIASQAAEVLE